MIKPLNILNMKVTKKNGEKKVITIMSVIAIVAIVVALIVIALLSFGGLGKKESGGSNQEISNPNKITRLDRIEITENDKLVDIEGKKYRVRKEISVDGAFLLIDGEMQKVWNSSTVYADVAYVTNKYIFFTIRENNVESIVYAIDKDGQEIGVDIIECTMHDFKIVDGVIQARGHITCGTDGECPDTDIVINLENDIVTIKIK